MKKLLLKTGSLDNAILAFLLAQPSWYMSHYTMLPIFGQCTRQFKTGNLLRFYFAKDRITPEEDRFNSQNTRKCNITRKNKQTSKQKSHRSKRKVIEKRMKIHETKNTSTSYERRQEFFVSSRWQGHSPINNCSLFIRHKEDHKQLATNTG